MLSAAVCVCDCVSVLTQSKSICHQGCHCGTKREGSLPGRTHSERNGERQRQATRRRGGVEEKVRPKGQKGPPSPAATTPNAPAVIRKIRLSNSLINSSGWRESAGGVGRTLRCVRFGSLVRSSKSPKCSPLPAAEQSLSVDVDEEIKSSPLVGLMLC